jgi:hypothetical protein
MASLLACIKHRISWAGLISLLLCLCIGIGEVYATTYTGTFTGYAMGNLYNGQGLEIYQTDFANHFYDYCPNDPAAAWPNGIHITTSNAITLHDAAGYPYTQTTFWLNDVGDFQCNMGDYWVDIYFGRYRRSGEACSCNNGNEVCWTNYSNSCSDATNYGRHLYQEYSK